MLNHEFHRRMKREKTQETRKESPKYRKMIDELPCSLLGDVTWFIRQPASEASVIGENMGVVDIIMDRCNIMDDPDKRMKKDRLDLKKEISMDKITISYQIDRYHELDAVKKTYTAANFRRVKVQCSSEEEFETKSKEFFDKYGFISSSKEELWISYVSKDDSYFTVGDILNHIYLFYHQIMNESELQDVSGCDDGWGYADKAANALKNGTILYRHEIMGDCMHFEGLSLNSSGDAPYYELCLGS